MNDKEKVIKGLEFTKAMITFNPSTGKDIEPGNLNELDKISYDACVGAIALLKEQETIVRCKDCKYCEYQQAEKEWCKKGHLHGNAEKWFCADGERKESEIEK